MEFCVFETVLFLFIFYFLFFIFYFLFFTFVLPSHYGLRQYAPAVEHC
jgi:hypothetical protein